MTPLDLVRLTALTDRTAGRPDVIIGLIDGPVAMNHPELASQHIHEIPGNARGACTQANSMACLHGTFVAGILVRQAGIGRSSDLSRLHLASAADLRRNDSGERRDAERDARRTRPGHSRLY